MIQLARNIAADAFDKSHGGRMAASQRMRDGKADDHEMVQCALSALSALKPEGEQISGEVNRGFTLSENAKPTFECAARSGSVGANDPQDCDHPYCGCDPSEQISGDARESLRSELDDYLITQTVELLRLSDKGELTHPLGVATYALLRGLAHNRRTDLQRIAELERQLFAAFKGGAMWMYWADDNSAEALDKAAVEFSAKHTPSSEQISGEAVERVVAQPIDRTKFPYMWEGKRPSETIIHQVINRYMGESDREHDYDQFKYYLNNWHGHYELNKRMRAAAEAALKVTP